MTLANLITLVRLGLVPFLVYFLEVSPTSRAALALFLVASLTDWVDGYIARRFNQTSNLGALLDPLVDKVLVTAAIVGLARHGVISAWSVTLVLTREFLITGLRTAAINAGVVLAASWTGKVKTTLQMTAIALLLAGIHPWGDWLWWAAIVMTAYSGLEYLWQTRRIWV